MSIVLTPVAVSRYHRITPIVSEPRYNNHVRFILVVLRVVHIGT